MLQQASELNSLALAVGAQAGAPSATVNLKVRARAGHSNE
eukprot:CAMPEP_0119468470 /NCGR_PEP_ID=MMETSP1344-20130328/2211_1 /TAXON_ID=236787 /ORGANISM="Florenciella parvula, Strain CCMP2471" /LENGTH=39 /DNA_ID= /DNA_START= /DNA_END= /DNA_ORIENTATION=